MISQKKLQIIQDDPYLEPYEDVFKKLRKFTEERIKQFEGEGGLQAISKSYLKYGIHRKNDHFEYQEWAPGAKRINIFGQFNDWNRKEYTCLRNQYGHWKCAIQKPIPEYSKIKCEVQLGNGDVVDRIPAWINFTTQNIDHSFDGLYVDLSTYEWKHPKPAWKNANLKIYECHIGMSGIDHKVHGFTHFKEVVLPKVISLGYNVIQIMGVMEHPYYGSFGYHVSNFFSVSSRFGKPHEFKEMVDEAHRHGIKVIIDIVHSHAAKNVNEGINMWDGTDYQYFHGDGKGNHPLWDSRVFDYSKYEVIRFLLSNVRFWLEEYNADGYRFDGVTSMLYTHHGAGYGFTGNYQQYFNENLDFDALAYLTIACLVAKSVYPEVILIAEDVSGLPSLCRSYEDGGIGFNYRLAMAVPDMWIKLLKQCKDEDWDIEKIVYELTNRRWKQKCIAYAQSHDQALVGDKTISMWVFDAETYTNMSVFNEETPRIFRGMALHKMIRLITFSLGGEGYLTFMGNEFGHPEWIDFPREGNGWSYQHCRRRWDLADDKTLRYHFLNNFQKKMIGLDVEYNVLEPSYQYIRTKHNGDKILVYEKGDLLFVFNFHHSNSYENYDVYVKSCRKIKVIFSTDDLDFGGHGRVHHLEYDTTKVDDFCSKVKLYIPNRTAIVFKIIL